MSPTGTRSINPSAYATCAMVTVAAAAEAETFKWSEMESRSG
ncbi:hypothetical protein N806_08925 [Rhodococcus sp. P27]|nr:hypothetical protein N806_08925 [Rhodococcus sp. P27]